MARIKFRTAKLWANQTNALTLEIASRMRASRRSSGLAHGINQISLRSGWVETLHVEQAQPGQAILLEQSFVHVLLQQLLNLWRRHLAAIGREFPIRLGTHAN